ncbi:MAG TPA: lmo0937 family membrane protein [Candidatus Dormibacteraeota bacterium]|nr:lmo0937 family membrane protein [Candidatus Dormibacteraeota bacterium]
MQCARRLYHIALTEKIGNSPPFRSAATRVCFGIGAVADEGDSIMSGILWTLIVVLFVFWLLGFTLFHLGGLIHIVLVVAIILLIFNLVSGRGARI